jgi:hypothetical protein
VVSVVLERNNGGMKGEEEKEVDREEQKGWDRGRRIKRWCEWWLCTV